MLFLYCTNAPGRQFCIINAVIPASFLQHLEYSPEMSNLKSAIENAEIMATEDFYCFNELEDTALRCTPDGQWYCKFKGREEYPIRHDTNMVAIACMNNIVLTKEEYEQY